MKQILWKVSVELSPASVGSDTNASTRATKRHGGREFGEEVLNVENNFRFYIGIDWSTQTHQICLADRDGKLLKQSKIEHSGIGIAQLLGWLDAICDGDRESVAPPSKSRGVPSWRV